MAAIVIAGASSDTGKTTLTLGILRALRNRGLAIQPFKNGPDYIDPMFHQVAAGVPSYNLDLFLLGEEKLKVLFAKHSEGDTLGIVEGSMGLYDGLGTEKDCYSTAHLSKVIDTPVILVINGSGMSASAAAMVLGFKLYDPAVKIAGVILNQLGSESHYALIKEAIERDTGIPCLGWMPKMSQLVLKSRHLGLVPVDELPELDAELDTLAEQVEKTLNLDQLIALAKISRPPSVEKSNTAQDHIFLNKRIGLFKDKAFNFYYEDNLEFLMALGAELVPISPLEDQALPDCDMLYIGGGYPEVFKEALSANQTFVISLKNALESGLPAYAECGGMMYLTKAIDGVSMVGFFEDETFMTTKLQRFGYVELQIGEALQEKAHEFHFSDVTQNEDLEYLFKVSKPQNKTKAWKCGRKKMSTIGSYPHIHFYGNLELVKVLFSI
jgi:cobyrinic acid a,c-diamide synthase